MKNVMELVMWFFVGAIIVLIVTHAPGFAQAVTAVGTQTNSLGTTLTGTNVTNAVYGKAYTN
jgi:hypothetical protein